MDDQRPSSSGTHGPDVLRPHRCIASTVTPSLNDTTRALMRHVLADEYAASLAACRRIQRLEAALALIQPADGLSLSDQSLCRSVGPTETVTITSQVPPNRSDDEAALHILRSRYDLDGLTSLITQLASHDATDNEPESPVSQKVPRFEVADNAAALAARMTAQLQARSDAYVAHRLSATKWPHRRFHGVEPLRHLEPINRPDLGPMLDACRRHVIDERQRDPADVGSPPTWSGRLNKALQTMLTQTTQVNDATLLAQTVTLDYQFGWNRPVAPFATRLLHANGVPDSYLHPRRLSFHQGEVPGRVHPLYESIIAGSESILSGIDFDGRDRYIATAGVGRCVSIYDTQQFLADEADRAANETDQEESNKDASGAYPPSCKRACVRPPLTGFATAAAAFRAAPSNSGVSTPRTGHIGMVRQPTLPPMPTNMLPDLQFFVPHKVACLAYVPSQAAQLVTADYAGNVLLYDVARVEAFQRRDAMSSTGVMGPSAPPNATVQRVLATPLTRGAGHSSRVWGLDVLRDPSRPHPIVLTGGHDQLVRVHDLRIRPSSSGLDVMTEFPVCAVAFRPTSTAASSGVGLEFAVGTAGRTIQLFDCRMPVAPYWEDTTTHEAAVSYVKWLERDVFVTSATDSCLRVFSPPSAVEASTAALRALNQGRACPGVAAYDAVRGGDPVAPPATAASPGHHPITTPAPLYRCVRELRGHRNERNFVGLAAWSPGPASTSATPGDGVVRGLIITGSERNRAYVYDPSGVGPYGALQGAVSMGPAWPRSAVSVGDLPTDPIHRLLQPQRRAWPLRPEGMGSGRHDTSSGSDDDDDDEDIAYDRFQPSGRLAAERSSHETWPDGLTATSDEEASDDSESSSRTCEDLLFSSVGTLPGSRDHRPANRFDKTLSRAWLTRPALLDLDRREALQMARDPSPSPHVFVSAVAMTRGALHAPGQGPLLATGNSAGRLQIQRLHLADMPFVTTG